MPGQRLEVGRPRPGPGLSPCLCASPNSVAVAFGGREADLAVTMATKGREMALVKVGRAGKITLPAALRRQLEIVEGDDLEAEVVEGGLFLKRVTEAERKRAWAEIRRIIDSPKWREPPNMSPEDEERMIFEEVEKLRHGDA
jgi:AbrB family looped-hinge helix DNA binding protein